MKATGEVFTPMPLCREMVAEIPLETKQDPYATFLDPSCGDGNFLVALLEELSKFHDPYWSQPVANAIDVAVSPKQAAFAQVADDDLQVPEEIGHHQRVRGVGAD